MRRIWLSGASRAAQVGSGPATAGQQHSTGRLPSDETLNKLKSFTNAREAFLETTPELLAGWVRDNARHPPITRCDICPTVNGIFGDPRWHVCLDMELTTLCPDDAEPVNVPDMIRFWLLELSQNPNRTKVTGECVAYPEVASHFDDLWNRMLYEFGAEEAQPPKPAGDGAGRQVRNSEQTGPKVGTLDRVREAHRLAKAGWSVTRACKKAHTDSRTYYQWCLKATGEEPIVPYEDI